MPNNQTIADAVTSAGLVNASAAGEVVKTIDLGAFAESLKGQTLQVCVNPASYIGANLWRVVKDISREEMLRCGSLP
jgi:hypothetical protein